MKLPFQALVPDLPLRSLERRLHECVSAISLSQSTCVVALRLHGVCTVQRSPSPWPLGTYLMYGRVEQDFFFTPISRSTLASPLGSMRRCMYLSDQESLVLKVTPSNGFALPLRSEAVDGLVLPGASYIVHLIRVLSEVYTR